MLFSPLNNYFWKCFQILEISDKSAAQLTFVIESGSSQVSSVPTSQGKEKCQLRSASDSSCGDFKYLKRKIQSSFIKSQWNLSAFRKKHNVNRPHSILLTTFVSSCTSQLGIMWLFGLQGLVMIVWSCFLTVPPSDWIIKSSEGHVQKETLSEKRPFLFISSCVFDRAFTSRITQAWAQLWL